MNKKSIWAFWLLLMPTLAISCADLRDSDECYRFGRLWCEKSCGVTDQNACLAEAKNWCHDAVRETDSDETKFNACSDKLADLSDCVDGLTLAKTCQDLPPRTA